MKKALLIIQMGSLLLLGCGGGTGAGETGSGGSGGKGGSAGKAGSGGTAGGAGHGSGGTAGAAVGGAGGAGNDVAGASGTGGAGGMAGEGAGTGTGGTAGSGTGTGGAAGGGSGGAAGSASGGAAGGGLAGQGGGAMAGAGGGVNPAGGTSGGGVGGGAPPATYPVGGSITGLTGSGLVLQNNLGDNLTVAANGTTFTFATALANGAAYSVTVLAQPSTPTQTCTVTNGTGHLGAGPVNDVAIACSTNTYSVGGSIIGLTGNGLVLHNGSDDLPLSGSATTFTFPTKVASGAGFAVSVKTQPASPSQTCMVTGGTGTIAAGNASSITVNCTTDQFAVGGSISGLAGTVTLTNNAGDDVNVTSNGTFSFPTLVTSGQPYKIEVKTQPATPSQTCTVTNGSGTVAGAMISATVACVTNAFKLKAAVMGVKAAGLTLENGTDMLAVSADGTVTVSAAVLSGTSYTLAIASQPVGQTCTIAPPASGMMGGSDVTINVSCVDNLYTVKATVSGVAGGKVTLTNGADSLLVGNGTASFPTQLTNGASYSVAASGPVMTCTVTNGSGTIAASDATVTVACDGGLAYYFPFDGDATDQSGNGHDGEVHGAMLTTGHDGTADGAYSFDGSSWIQAPGDDLPIGNTDRTLTAWVNPAAGSGSLWGIIYWGQNDCTGYMWGLGNQGSATFWGGCNDWGSPMALAPDTWSFVAVRFTAPNTIRIRVNGTVADHTLGVNPATQASNLWLGGETIDNGNFRNYFDGSIDSVRIYNRALTDAELDTISALP
ncbi:MAG: LamG-like jellyroll fold domain-containing protein [Polyangia bacterium]